MVRGTNSILLSVSLFGQSHTLLSAHSNILVVVHLHGLFASIYFCYMQRVQVSLLSGVGEGFLAKGAGIPSYKYTTSHPLPPPIAVIPKPCDYFSLAPKDTVHYSPRCFILLNTLPDYNSTFPGSGTVQQLAIGNQHLAISN